MIAARGQSHEDEVPSVGIAQGFGQVGEIVDGLGGLRDLAGLVRPSERLPDTVDVDPDTSQPLAGEVAGQLDPLAPGPGMIQRPRREEHHGRRRSARSSCSAR